MSHIPPLDAGLGAARPSPLLDAVTACLEEAVLVVDGDRRLRHLNGAAATLLGLDAGALGRRLGELPLDYRLTAIVTACLGPAGEIERELADPGEGRHIVARGQAVRAAGDDQPLVVVVLRDDSRLRRLETVRRDFVANVSHELRTPIAAIQLLVDTLQGGALADPGVAGEFVEKIGLEVGHIAQMVGELLELSTIEAGQRTIQRLAVPVATLLDAARRLQPLADERHVTVEQSIVPGTPAVVGDPQALAQVVRNLVHNAIKFTPPGGRITLRGAPHETEPGIVELRVSDTGCGIPAGEQGRIFERFYKADKSRQRDGEGTGLGLAIARHTLQVHGGRITVESEPGAGTTFIVALPAAGDGPPDA